METEASVDGQRYEYDPADRVSKVWRTEGTSSTGDDVLLLTVNYDALNRRVESKEWIDATTGGVLSTPSHTWHVFDGLSVIEEYDVDTSGPTATLAREFVWGGSFIEPVALIDHTDAGDESSSEAEVLHYLTDILGSVVALTNTNGEIVEAYEYDPYGETYISDLDGNGDHITASYRKYSRFGNPFMWTGQRYDSTTRNYHFWARMFSTQLGRWLQRDPLGYVDGENLFQYSLSMPLIATDPLGLGSSMVHPGSITEAVGALLDMGYTKAEIAKQLGVSVAVVAAAIARINTSSVSPPLPPQGPKKKPRRKTPKERSKDLPTWADGLREFAKRVCAGKLTPVECAKAFFRLKGKQPASPKHPDFTKIKKWLERNRDLWDTPRSFWVYLGVRPLRDIREDLEKYEERYPQEFQKFRSCVE